MVASVCMYSMLELDRPSSLLPLCTELTIPDVIVFCNENGLPMATTNSPCRMSDDWLSVRVGNGFCMSGERKSIWNKALCFSVCGESTHASLAPFTETGLYFLAHPCRDFDGGDVRHRVDILHDGIVRLSIGELHTDASLVGYNVGIGDDETIAADDKTGAVWHWDLSSWERVSVKK